MRTFCCLFSRNQYSCFFIFTGDRVKYIWPSIHFEADNRPLPKGQRGEVYEVSGDRVAVLLDVKQMTGTEVDREEKDAEQPAHPPVYWHTLSGDALPRSSGVHAPDRKKIKKGPELELSGCQLFTGPELGPPPPLGLLHAGANPQGLEPFFSRLSPEQSTKVELL
ncbi:hypothetical protein ACFX2G_019944 [Malus domestica]